MGGGSKGGFYSFLGFFSSFLFRLIQGLRFSSSMDSFASWRMNASGMEKEEREETPLQGEDEFRRSSPP
ncbi:hypothetical protein HKD37_11G031432 [Glycine soja]|nr:hypothetical protein GmHk_11G032034 [Glycine max]